MVSAVQNLLKSGGRWGSCVALCALIGAPGALWAAPQGGAKASAQSQKAQRKSRSAARPSQAQGASLMVTVEGKGAEVWVAGSLVGRTPLTEPVQLEPGRYLVEVRHRAYLTYREEIELNSAEERLLNPVLLPAPALLTLRGEPAGAQVWWAGRRLGVLPFTGKVEAGEGDLMVHAEGYESHQSPLRLDPGQEMDRQVSLKVQSGAAAAAVVGTSAPAEAESAPIYQRWWFWTGLGTLALVGTGLAIWASQPAPRQSPDYQFDLELRP